MPDFAASPLVDALEENLFSLLEKLAAEVNTEALPLIDLSSGSPDQPTPPEVIDSLQSAIHRRENHGYPSFWGKPQVREAIAAVGGPQAFGLPANLLRQETIVA